VSDFKPFNLPSRDNIVQIYAVLFISLTIVFAVLSSTGVSVNINAQNRLCNTIVNQLLPNNTDLTNSSNITRHDSNITNRSEIANTTIPEQLTPESVNGSKTGKI